VYDIKVIIDKNQITIFLNEEKITDLYIKILSEKYTSGLLASKIIELIVSEIIKTILGV